MGVCTDGALAMLGCRSGFQTLVKERSLQMLFVLIALLSRSVNGQTMPDNLLHVLNNAIKAVNFIKANAVDSRLFAELCKESDSMFKSFLVDTRFRWLSKGKVLKRVFLLRKEIQEFLCKLKPKMHKNFFDDRFLIFLCFLVNIFESVNSVNLALEGKEVNVTPLPRKIDGF